MMHIILTSVVAVLLSLAGSSLGQYTKAANCSVDAFENSFTRAYGHFGSEKAKLPETQAKLTKYCKYVC